MLNKQEALQEVISLIKRHHISLTEIQNALAEPGLPRNSSTIKKLFAFLGGIFIFCGVGIYITQHWGDMNSAARIIITFGTGFTLLIMAITASFDARYEKIITPLFVLSAFFETSGMFVILNELFPASDHARLGTLAVFGAMLWQQLFIFWKIPRSSLLFFCLLFGTAFLCTLFDIWEIKSDHIMMVIGLSLTCISYGIHNTRHQTITPFWYLLGSTIFLVGLFSILKHSWFEIAFLGVSTFVIFLSTVVASRMLLFVGTIAMISYIGYFTEENLLDSIGWPIALIGFGIVMLGISTMAFNISKSIKH